MPRRAFLVALRRRPSPAVDPVDPRPAPPAGDAIDQVDDGATVSELRAIAQRLGVGYRRLRKADLVVAINDHLARAAGR